MEKNDIKKQTVPAIIYVKKMRDYSKEPVFIKKKEKMITLLEKYGLPDGSKFKRHI